jgi:hypothetical protein
MRFDRDKIFAGARQSIWGNFNELSKSAK